MATPLTDALDDKLMGTPLSYVKMTRHARRLEASRAALVSALDSLNEATEQYLAMPSVETMNILTATLRETRAVLDAAKELK